MAGTGTSKDSIEATISKAAEDIELELKEPNWIPIKDAILFFMNKAGAPWSEVAAVLSCTRAQAKKRQQLILAAHDFDLPELADKPGARSALEAVIIARMASQGSPPAQVASVLGCSEAEAEKRCGVVSYAVSLAHQFVIEMVRNYPDSVCHRYDGHRLVVSFPDSEEAKNAVADLGYHNHTHVAWALSRVKWVLRGCQMLFTRAGVRKADHERAPEKILILAMYPAQVELYESEMVRLLSNGFFTPREAEKVDIKLYDPFQDDEEGEVIVIVDFVTTESLGDCEDRRLQSLALRHRYGITTDIILANKGMACRGGPGQPVERVIAKAEEGGYLLEIDCCRRCLCPWHEVDECAGRRVKPCSECGEPGHIRVDCYKVECKNCHQTGHAVGRCPVQPLCDHCGAEGYGHDGCDFDSEGYFGIVWEIWAEDCEF